MAKQLKKTSRIKNILAESSELEEKVIEMIGAGYSPREVTHRVDVTLSKVNTIMDKFMANYAMNLSERAESVYHVSMHRLDTMYTRLAPYAYPRGNPVDPLNEDDPYYEGNPALLNILLKNLKEVREWHKMQSPSHDDGNVINIDHVEVTMSTNNDLYKQALSSEQEDWMKIADTPVEELYLTPEVEDKVEERINALAKAAGVTFDDDEA